MKMEKKETRYGSYKFKSLLLLKQTEIQVNIQQDYLQLETSFF